MNSSIWESFAKRRDPIITEPNSPDAHSANTFARLIPPSFSDVVRQSFNQSPMVPNDLTN